MAIQIRVTNLAGNLLTDGTPTSAACDALNAQIVRAIREDLPNADVQAAVVPRAGGDNPHPLTISGHEGLEREEQERIERLAQAGAEEGYDRWLAALTDSDLETA